MKCIIIHLRVALVIVAPHWGAWIEIMSAAIPGAAAASRTPLGCVD